MFIQLSQFPPNFLKSPRAFMFECWQIVKMKSRHDMQQFGLDTSW